jgi:Zn-dependent metalloprotease
MARLALAMTMTAALACSSGSSKTATKGTPDAGAAAGLDRDTGVSWVVSTGSGFAPTTHVFPQSPPPPALTGGQAPVDVARAFLATYGGTLFGLADPSSELTPLPLRPVDGLGLQWVSLQQVVQGVPVAGRTIQVVFDRQGSIALVWSGYLPDARSLSVTPAVTADAARQAAQADRAAATGLSSAQVTTTPPMLAVFVRQTAAILGWQTYATPDGSAGSPDPWVYIVDAQSGAIVSSADTVETGGPYSGSGTVTTAEGLGSYKDSKSFFVYQSATTPPANYLQQDVPGASSQEWADYLPSLQASVPAVELSSSTPDATSSTWSPMQPVAPGADVDAFVYINDAAFWWWSNFGWSSWDGRGSPIQIAMYPAPPDNAPNPEDYLVDNAAWSGGNHRFVVGQPSNPALPSTVAAVDVMGHEYTHAVNSNALCVGAPDCQSGGQPVTVPLSPFAFSGAMNESLSDCFGQYLEQTVEPTGYAYTPAISGEGAGDNFLRNLQDPHQTTFTRCQQVDGTFAQPDNVLDPYYTAPPVTTYPPNTSAVGQPCTDVHYFAGVPNNAWYLATFGGTNGTSQVSVSLDDSLALPTSQALYGSLMLGAQQGSVVDFHDVATALTQIARDTYGDANQSTEVRAVGCSWYAVGVFTPDELFRNFGVQDCQCPPSTPDGTFCGGHGIWQSTAGSLYTCAGGQLVGIDPCQNEGTGQCLTNDPPGTDACEKRDAGAERPDADGGTPDAASAAGCFASAGEVGSTLGLSGVTGPAVDDTLNDGQGDLERVCTFSSSSATVTIDYDVLGYLGGAKGQTLYNMLQTMFADLGEGETPVALGQSAFAVTTAGSPNPFEVVVLVSDTTVVVLEAPSAPLAQQVSLLQLVLGRI